MIGRTIVKYDSDMLRDALNEVIESGQFVNGSQGKRFEKAVCDYLDIEGCVAVNSGTTALLLAYKAMGAKKILTTPFTFSATAMAGIFLDMEVIFCDIDADTYCMDMNDVERLLEEHGDIDVVVPVHIFGVGADMDALADLKSRYGFKVVSDCAQAFGTVIDGYLAGSHPCIDLGCFSLYPTKNLSCAGDGGFITLNDLKLYEKLIRWRDNGRYLGTPILGSGGNFRMSEFQAAIAVKLIERFPQQQEYRNEIAEYYLNELKPLEEKGILTLPKVKEFNENGWSHTYHLFCIYLNQHEPQEVIQKLSELGVGATPAYGYLITDFDMLEEGCPYSSEEYPVAREITERLLAIPLSQYITNEESVKVVESLFEVLGDA